MQIICSRGKLMNTALQKIISKITGGRH